jgi:hypothetical protein
MDDPNMEVGMVKQYLVIQKPNYSLALTIIISLLTIAFSAGTAVMISVSESKVHAESTFLTKETYSKDQNRIHEDFDKMDKKMDKILEQLQKYMEKK